MALVPTEALDELVDGLRLVALGLKIGDYPELAFVSVSKHQEKDTSAGAAGQACKLTEAAARGRA